MWVLIVYVVSSGSVRAPLISFQEFSSIDNCAVAAAKIVHMIPDGAAVDCVKK